MVSFVRKHKIILGFSLFGILCLLAMVNIVYPTDYDYFFHYFTGEYIVKNHQIPTTAIGSWYGLENSLPWISHEWLFGLMFYLIAQIGGEQLVSLMPLFILSGIIIWLVWTQRNRLSKNIVFTCFMIFILAYDLRIGYSPRPHLFAYLFTIALYLILNRDLEKQDNSIYLLIPLTILWVNFHGGSYMLLFVMAGMSFFWETFKFDFKNYRADIIFSKQNKKRWIVLLLSAFTVLLNGHGINMILYPLTNMSDDVMQSVIQEWFAPDLKNASYYPFYACALITMIGFIFTKKKIRLFDLFFWLGMLALSLRSMRFIPQFTIAAFLIGFRYCDGIPNLITKKNLVNITMVAIIGLTGAVTMLNLMNNFELYKDNGNRIMINRNVLPGDEVIDKIKEVKPKRLFNMYGAGGYLLYNHINTFIDGRADIFSAYNLSDYITISRYKNGAEELLNKYNFDYLLVENTTSLSEHIKTTNGKYKVIKEDNNYTLYENLAFKDGE